MISKKRILFVNDEMEMGGVARVLNTLMANIDKTKYEVDVLVLHPTGMLLKEIPENVNVINGTSFFKTVDQTFNDLVKKGDLSNLLSKIRLVTYMKTGLIKNKIQKERKKIIKKPYDVEVAAKEGFCTIFTAFGDSKKKINWVLTDYSVCNYSANHMPLVKEALQRIDLNIADSKEALQAYFDVFDVNNGITIHNLMDTTKVLEGMKIEADKTQMSNDTNVICVARFHPQKAIDRLILAHKASLDAGYKNHLYLIGGGEEEEKYVSLVAENNLQNTVHFLGYKQNPYADIAQSDLFVLSSLYEGFATIVNESLIAHTPVLSTKVSGIEEQIIHPSYGWIVDNSQEALNKGYIDAIKDPQKLKEMKKDLESYVYPNKEILHKFEEVF